MDTDRVFTRVNRMWWRLGRLFEAAAVESINRRFHEQAMQCARMAEACYWQATGESDAASVRDFAEKQ